MGINSHRNLCSTSQVKPIYWPLTLNKTIWLYIFGQASCGTFVISPFGMTA